MKILIGNYGGLHAHTLPWGPWRATCFGRFLFGLLHWCTGRVLCYSCNSCRRRIIDEETIEILAVLQFLHDQYSVSTKYICKWLSSIKHIPGIEPRGSSDKLVPAAGHGHAAVAWAGVRNRAETAQTQVREPAITLIYHQNLDAKLTLGGLRPSCVQIGARWKVFSMSFDIPPSPVL